MTRLYNEDLESYDHVDTLAEFTPVGTGSAFIVLDATISPPAWLAARGTKSYGAADSRDANYWNGDTALTNQAIRTATVLKAGAYLGHSLRIQLGGADRCYLCYFDLSAGNLRATIDKRDSSSVAETSSSYSIPAVAGDIVHMESRAVGTAIECRVWVNSAARPSTPTVSITDGTWTVGAIGLRRVIGGSIYVTADDIVITDGAGGEDFYYPAAASILASEVNTAFALASAGALPTGLAAEVDTAFALLPPAGFDFDTGAGLTFGDLAGALTGLAREAAVGMVLRVYAVASPGALVHESGTLTTDSNGRLTRYTHASLSASVEYHCMLIRNSDGEVLAVKLQAS